LPAQPQAKASSFPLHPQGLSRVTKQLSPSLPFERHYPGNVVEPRQRPANMAEESVPQQPYFEPGVAIGKQHFWSAEPVEWSPIGNLQNINTLKNDVPLHAGTYLQEKDEMHDIKPARNAASSCSQSSLSAPVVSDNVPNTMNVQSTPEQDEEGESSFALRFRKLLPLIVVVLLLLGLLGALLSSAFFPSSGPGAEIVPLHSLSRMLVSSLREITL